jgi:L-asparagine transporter-like permease
MCLNIGNVFQKLSIGPKSSYLERHPHFSRILRLFTSPALVWETLSYAAWLVFNEVFLELTLCYNILKYAMKFSVFTAVAIYVCITVSKHRIAQNKQLQCLVSTRTNYSPSNKLFHFFLFLATFPFK